MTAVLLPVLNQRNVAEEDCTSTTLVPFKWIEFDILGPPCFAFQIAKKMHPSCHRLLQAHPIPDQEALTTAKVLILQWVSRYGTPLQIHSNQGKSPRGVPSLGTYGVSRTPVPSDLSQFFFSYPFFLSAVLSPLFPLFLSSLCYLFVQITNV